MYYSNCGTVSRINRYLGGNIKCHFHHIISGKWKFSDWMKWGVSLIRWIKYFHTLVNKTNDLVHLTPTKFVVEDEWLIWNRIHHLTDIISQSAAGCFSSWQKYSSAPGYWRWIGNLHVLRINLVAIFRVIMNCIKCAKYVSLSGFG